jgi:hypothetical protein
MLYNLRVKTSTTSCIVELGIFTARLKVSETFFATYIFLKKNGNRILVCSVARSCGFISMSLEFCKARIFKSNAQLSISLEIFHIDICIFYIAPLLI